MIIFKQCKTKRTKSIELRLKILRIFADLSGKSGEIRFGLRGWLQGNLNIYGHFKRWKVKGN